MTAAVTASVERMAVLELVLFLKRIDPMLVRAVPRVRELAPVKVWLAKVGVAVEFIFWIVLTTPLETVKLVELNEATPVVLVVALATEIAPLAETDTGELPDTATVPEEFGMWMVLAAVGETKSRVVLLEALVPKIRELPT